MLITGKEMFECWARCLLVQGLLLEESWDEILPQNRKAWEALALKAKAVYISDSVPN